MANNPIKIAEDQGTAIFEVDASGVAEMTGSENRAFQSNLLDQVIQALWVPANRTQDKQLATAEAAIAALQGIKPRDELEGMLAAQMVATHHAAMECLRRAMLSEQTFEGRDQNLKHAAKMLSMFTRQLEVLDKHRGKGQQKITVEHVNVHAGGQAIVGNVSRESKHEAAPQSAVLPALEHQSEPAMPDLILEEAPKTKQKAPTR